MEQESTEYQRLSVEEIQELAGEPLPERVALSLFRAGIGILPPAGAEDILVDPPKPDEMSSIPPGEGL